jgi:hypothetical protein
VTGAHSTLTQPRPFARLTTPARLPLKMRPVASPPEGTSSSPTATHTLENQHLPPCRSLCCSRVPSPAMSAGSRPLPPPPRTRKSPHVSFLSVLGVPLTRCWCALVGNAVRDMILTASRGSYASRFYMPLPLTPPSCDPELLPLAGHLRFNQSLIECAEEELMLS